MPVIPYGGVTPDIASSVFVAPTAWITGHVTIGPESSVFFGVSMRGDIQKIIVGRRTNLQDNAILHTSHGLPDCVVGDDVTVGHAAIIHGCTVKNHCIIGMGATLLDGAVIEKNCIIGAQSLVPMNMVIPTGSLALGIPAKVIRKLSTKEIKEIELAAKHYVEVSREYRAHFTPNSGAKC